MKEKEDWSLKGKGWIDIPDLDMTPDEYNKWKIGEAQSLATTNVNLKSDDDVKVYPKEVIETLRLKLIEDIKKLKPITDGDDAPGYITGFYNGYDDAICCVELIIKERFGVE